LAQQLSSSATLPFSVLRIENVGVTVLLERLPETTTEAGSSTDTAGAGDPNNPDSPVQVESKVPVTWTANNNVTASITVKWLPMGH
jgi:hypothetical protein